MKEIWVISDVPETAWEILSKAQEIKKNTGSTITAYIIGDESAGEETLNHGADQVKLMEMPEYTMWERYAPVLAREANTVCPHLIMIGASRRGKDLAAQLAALLDAPCVTDCKDIECKDMNTYITERVIFGGLAYKQMESCGTTLVVTIAAHSYAKCKSDAAIHGRKGSITRLEKPSGETVRVVERKPDQKVAADFKASIFIGVGRGFDKKEELKYAESLARELGAEIVCTKPVAQDYQWFPDERFVGMTGKLIKPALYIAVGISGQPQHVYGVREAGLIVAINNKQDAPIFDVADYYIVGDLKEYLPVLTGAIRSVKAGRS